MEVGQLISDFGFPIVMAVGMGYFVYFVYQTILTKVDPAVEDMKAIKAALSSKRLGGTRLTLAEPGGNCRGNPRTRLHFVDDKESGDTPGL